MKPVFTHSTLAWQQLHSQPSKGPGKMFATYCQQCPSARTNRVIRRRSLGFRIGVQGCQCTAIDMEPPSPDACMRFSEPSEQVQVLGLGSRLLDLG